MLITTYACVKNKLSRDRLISAVKTALLSYLPEVDDDLIGKAVDKNLVPDTLPVPYEDEGEVEFSFALDPLGVKSFDERREMYRGMEAIWKSWLLRGRWFSLRDTIAKKIEEVKEADRIVRIYYLTRMFSNRDLLTFSCLSKQSDLNYFSSYVFEVENDEFVFVEFLISPATRIWLMAEILHLLKYVEPSEGISIWEQAAYEIPPLIFAMKQPSIIGVWGVQKGWVFWQYKDRSYRFYIHSRLRVFRNLFMMDISKWKASIASLRKKASFMC